MIAARTWSQAPSDRKSSPACMPASRLPVPFRPLQMRNEPAVLVA